jgi:hypothetical protein
MVFGKGVVAGRYEKILSVIETDETETYEPLEKRKENEDGRIKCHSEEGKYQKMEADACGERED